MENKEFLQPFLQEDLKNTLYPENLKYATKSGRKMRSKSERTIGNRLEDRGIVYWSILLGILTAGSVLRISGSVRIPVYSSSRSISAF